MADAKLIIQGLNVYPINNYWNTNLYTEIALVITPMYDLFSITLIIQYNADYSV